MLDALCRAKKSRAWTVRHKGHDPLAGQYNVPTGLGRQVYSTKKSSCGVRFGSAARDAAQKIYLSPEHDRAVGGGASPGPTTSNQRPAYGPQQLSRHARCWMSTSAPMSWVNVIQVMLEIMILA